MNSAKPRRDPNGIQSVDIAVKVLRGVASADGPISLKDLSALTKMPPSNLHRYLRSLTANGLVAHEGPTGKYALGTFAVQLGLAALQRIDLTNRTSDRLIELARLLGVSVCLSVWSERGPTVIRWEHQGVAIESVPIGSVLPMLWSASGMVFVSYLDSTWTHDLVSEQLSRLQIKPGQPCPDAEAITKTVREKGYAITRGGMIGGLTGIAAPIFGWQDEIIATVAIVIPTGDPDAELSHVPALLAFAKSCSGVENGPEGRNSPSTPTQRSLKRELKILST